ncbi:hypothetical protein Kpho02_72770 [Kitasatospora phosalacinea]|uniref:Uncharacterized protein n=1 Tax=Kitasatospora phosalacinea TaxID=2065 RepID=A0A9W6QEJ3_9ACTN|nr:hypothetical protein Kpho02_72770 [Kitasatospora phosalacinea]
MEHQDTVVGVGDQDGRGDDVLRQRGGEHRRVDVVRGAVVSREEVRARYPFLVVGFWDGRVSGRG